MFQRQIETIGRLGLGLNYLALPHPPSLPPYMLSMDKQKELSATDSLPVTSGKPFSSLTLSLFISLVKRSFRVDHLLRKLKDYPKNGRKYFLIIYLIRVCAVLSRV